MTDIGNPCSANPCINGGSCQRLGSQGYFCACPSSCTGYNCSTCRKTTTTTTTLTTTISSVIASTTAHVACKNYNETICEYFSHKGFCQSNVIYRNVSFTVSCARSCKTCAHATEVEYLSNDNLLATNSTEDFQLNYNYTTALTQANCTNSTDC